jgi:hypothetical protein
MSKQFYIGKKEGEELQELEEWIADRIPPAPGGTLCEGDQHEDDEGIRPPATTYLYFITADQHVCYTYVCVDCGERADPEYLCDQEYPATGGGYAVVPQHCAE